MYLIKTIRLKQYDSLHIKDNVLTLVENEANLETEI